MARMRGTSAFYFAPARQRHEFVLTSASPARLGVACWGGCRRLSGYNSGMARPRLPHPYVTAEPTPEFKTPNDVATFIAEWQTRGHIKRCAHAKVSSPYGGGYSSVPVYYVPECEKDSFVRLRAGEGGYTRRPLWAFEGCPPDCRMYEAAWRGRLKRRVRRVWRDVEWRITGIAKWYASLSGWTQVIIALALLALAGAPWRTTVLDGLKILAGK